MRNLIHEVKNPNSINKQQNQKIAALERKVAQLKLAKGMSKKAARSFKKRVRISGARSPVTSDPVALSVKAMIKPFDVPKGVASSLAYGRPCQKFMAKANTSFTVPAGCTMVFMCSPCVASDTIKPSVVFGIQTASGTPMSGPWKSNITGDKVVTGGTIASLSTNTPYSSGTLAGSGYEWSLVGAGLRFTYEGAELYKSGTFKYIHDIEMGFNQGYSDWGGKGPADIVTFVDNAPNSLRQSINKNNVVEINALVASQAYLSEGTSIFSTSVGAFVGGATASLAAGTTPMCLGYFLNSSSNSISFHVETVEHWNVSAPGLQALHTASVAHPVLSEQVGNFLHTARQLHASQPNAHHVDVMKTAKQTMGSPLGHEVLNAALTAALA